jgi:hypothetical protein
MPAAEKKPIRAPVIAAVLGGLVVVLYVSACFLRGYRNGLGFVEVLSALRLADCGFLLPPTIPILFTVAMLFVPEQGRVARALSWALYGLTLAFPVTVAILIHQFGDCGISMAISYLITGISLGIPAGLLLIGWVGARFVFERPRRDGEGRVSQAHSGSASV